MRERPIGISILAILHVVGGLFLGAVQLILIARPGATYGTLRAAGLSPVAVIAGVLFLAALGLAAGVGMWLGTKWGWWLGAFYYVYGVARHLSALLAVAQMADQLADSRRGPEYYYAKHASRSIVHLLILFYFLRPNVLAYFGLERMDKPKAIARLVGICCAIGLVATLASALAS